MIPTEPGDPLGAEEHKAVGTALIQPLSDPLDPRTIFFLRDPQFHLDLLFLKP
jgi:hypothetical protein